MFLWEAHLPPRELLAMSMRQILRAVVFRNQTLTREGSGG